jgi:hypothetical protein
MGHQLEFHKLIRSTVQIDEAIVEDVVEAFFGNLFTLSNRLGNSTPPSLGFSLCCVVFDFVFKKSFPALNILDIKKDPQTVLDQMFQKLGWGHPEFVYDKTIMRSTVRLSHEASEKLKATCGNQVIGQSEGSNKKDAERKACILAIDFLKKTWNIDQKYIKRAVRDRLMSDPRYLNAHSMAMSKAYQLGFADIYVQRKSKNRVQYYIVTGVKPDESECALSTYVFQDNKSGDRQEGNHLDGQINALSSYVSL